MLDWLKNIAKEHPDFWKNYLSKFDSKSNKFVVISIETNGLNTKNDSILSISAVGIINETIHIGDVVELIIGQQKQNDNSYNSNTNNEIPTKNELTQIQAIEMFINFIGNATLVGHRIHFDIEMINEVLEKNACGRIKNEALDIEVMYKRLYDINDKNFALDELRQAFKIDKTERISTTEDAFTIALLFLKLKSRLGL